MVVACEAPGQWQVMEVLQSFGPRKSEWPVLVAAVI